VRPKRVVYWPNFVMMMMMMMMMMIIIIIIIIIVPDLVFSAIK
jgi:hypothetical protein